MPDLAERWDVDDGGRTYRFVLRTGVTMHDGAELTADDVKRSVERALHPSTPEPERELLRRTSPATRPTPRARPSTSTASPSRAATSSRSTWRSPTRRFLISLALHTLRPTCKSARRPLLGHLAAVRRGPFQARSRAAGSAGRACASSATRATSAPGCRTSTPSSGPTTCCRSRSASASSAASSTSLRDLTQADDGALPRRSALDEASARPRPTTRIYGEAMNTRMPPFDNVEIRRAVAAAIDREHYALLQPPAMVALLTQALPRGVAGRRSVVPRAALRLRRGARAHARRPGYPYDPATGTRRLAAAHRLPDLRPGPAASTRRSSCSRTSRRSGSASRIKLVSWAAFLALQQRAGRRRRCRQGNWSSTTRTRARSSTRSSRPSAIAPEGSLQHGVLLEPAPRRPRRARAPRDGRRGAQARSTAQAERHRLRRGAVGVHLRVPHFDVRQPYVHGFAAAPGAGALDVAPRVGRSRGRRRSERALGGGCDEALRCAASAGASSSCGRSCRSRSP